MGVLDKIKQRIWAAKNKDKIEEFKRKAHEQAVEFERLIGPILQELQERQEEDYTRGVTQEEIERYYEKHKKVQKFRGKVSSGWNTGGSMWATTDMDNLFPLINEEYFGKMCRRHGWDYIKENCFLEAAQAENGMTFYVDIMTDGNGYDHLMYWTFDAVPEQQEEQPEIHLQEQE